VQRQQFEVQKNNLAKTRVSNDEIAPLEDGEVLVHVDRFALTANNITYGVVGEKIGYWKFFPVDDDWGVIPVWGFADVVDSKTAGIEIGERLYGYFPTATHLRLRPGKISDQRLVDTLEHRKDLPAVYNAYARTSKESWYDEGMDDERMLLFPLFATSYCLFDFLQDNDNFGATQIIVCSASSKTAIGLAYALQQAPNLVRVGLTSAKNLAAVSDLGIYNEAFDYDNIGKIDNGVPSVIVDMSGNGELLSRLHAHLGENMRFTSSVGLTHHGHNTMGPDFIHERSAMFFAPGHIKKRTEDWGPGEFEKKAVAFWHGAATKSRDWLSIDLRQGMDEMQRAYEEVLGGSSSPAAGIVISL
jgi:hypothetical protein